MPEVALTPYDLMALGVLAEDSGYATGRIVEMAMGRPTTQSMSAVMKAAMFRLEKRGLVGRLDDEKPIAWTRSAAGTEAVRQAAAMADPRPRGTSGEGGAP